MSKYHYIYHQKMRQNKYDRPLARIESSIQKLGLKGPIERLLQLSNPEEVVTRILKNANRPSTLVVVGDDELLCEVINTTLNSNHSVTLGFIPMFSETNITHNLGLALGAAGVEVLAGRIIKTLDVGVAGKKYFIDSLVVKSQKVAFIINKSFTLSPNSNITQTKIHNLKDYSLPRKTNRQIDPQDETLNISFITDKRNLLFQRDKPKVDSSLPCKTVKISSLDAREIAVLADGYIKLKTPLTVGVQGRAFKIIVGKNRLID